MSNFIKLVQAIERFKMLLAVAVIIILSFLHIFFRPVVIEPGSSIWAKFWDLVHTCIPSVMSHLKC